MKIVQNLQLGQGVDIILGNMLLRQLILDSTNFSDEQVEPRGERIEGVPISGVSDLINVASSSSQRLKSQYGIVRSQLFSSQSYSRVFMSYRECMDALDEKTSVDLSSILPSDSEYTLYYLLRVRRVRYIDSLAVYTLEPATARMLDNMQEKANSSSFSLGLINGGEQNEQSDWISEALQKMGRGVITQIEYGQESIIVIEFILSSLLEHKAVKAALQRNMEGFLNKRDLHFELELEKLLVRHRYKFHTFFHAPPSIFSQDQQIVLDHSAPLNHSPIQRAFEGFWDALEGSDSYPVGYRTENFAVVTSPARYQVVAELLDARIGMSEEIYTKILACKKNIEAYWLAVDPRRKLFRCIPINVNEPNDWAISFFRLTELDKQLSDLLKNFKAAPYSYSLLKRCSTIVNRIISELKTIQSDIQERLACCAGQVVLPVHTVSEEVIHSSKHTNGKDLFSLPASGLFQVKIVPSEARVKMKVKVVKSDVGCCGFLLGRNPRVHTQTVQRVLANDDLVDCKFMNYLYLKPCDPAQVPTSVTFGARVDLAAFVPPEAPLALRFG